MKTNFTKSVKQNMFSVLFSSNQQYVLSFIFFVLIGLINFNLLAQTEAQRLQIKSKTNVAALQQMAIDFGNYASQRKVIAEQWATSNGLPVSGETSDGQVFILIDYDSISGPQYIITTNSNSAQTISTDKVLPGGSSGLNLSGSGITISMWDGGALCDQHPEYINRVFFGPHETSIPSVSRHANHVAGTLIASGISPIARGMAPAADVNYYLMDNFASEISLEAADGTLLSNHSWGAINQGWAYDGIDWRWVNSVYTEYQYFGLYIDWTQILDQIANNAPYHLMIKSSGNDRGYGPPAGTIHSHYFSGVPNMTDFHEINGGVGGFDCMDRYACAKNVLTVGATFDIPNGYTSPSNVALAGFSNTGPTDDGRIKPDVVANGIGLYSSYNSPNLSCVTLGYNSLSGTSMSAPSVTGSAALLQEHYSNTHSSAFMLASTLKALIIETTDEAGANNGPDYHHGWGLMNTNKAAEIITKDLSEPATIQELTLANGQTINIPFTIPNTDNCYLSATIVWNDPAGTPPPVSLDPTDLMLVNDLDLRIIDPLSGINFPWTLDPLNPANAAIQTADNFRDNVEQVRIYNAIPGSYIVRITHKGTLLNPQDFSIIINNVPTDGLYIADSPVDIGNEPDAETISTFGNVFWNSSDIWIRQTNDGFALANQVSEPIEYTSGIPNYIYVRVKNKGLCPQTADLRVYWAKASTGLSWPSQWDNYNTTYASCAASLYGDEITPSTTITVPAQSEQIFEIPWQPNNPDDYNCFVDPFHFCLLGRLETTPVAPYGMTFPEGTSVWSNTVDNNNIAWKNVIINNNNPGKFEPFGTTIVRNVEEKENFINLNFVSQKDDIGQHLIDFKRIQLYFSVDFIKRWAEGGKRGKDIVMVNDSVVEILSANATMENIFLRYNEIGAVSLALETKKDPMLSNDKYFNFDIIQYTKDLKIPQGGQTYQIKKGVSRKDCLTPAHEVSKIISGNQVYSDSTLVSGNIIVPHGATLSFKKATVMLAENASINVMPGGKLIIDASRLESSCIGKKWAGIEVKGAPAFQSPLAIKNSFITGSDSPLSLDKTQGILISQSTFLGDNIGTAIVMNKMKDFQISENTFSNFITGIKTTNTSEAEVKSIIEKNIFLNVKIALDFTKDKHTKLDVKCNRFSYTDYATGLFNSKNKFILQI